MSYFQSNGKFSSFSNLIANTSYRFRLSRLMGHGVSRSEVSDWFSTYDGKLFFSNT